MHQAQKFPRRVDLALAETLVAVVLPILGPLVAILCTILSALFPVVPDGEHRAAQAAERHSRNGDDQRNPIRAAVARFIAGRHCA
jgi:hypothetical protein